MSKKRRGKIYYQNAKQKGVCWQCGKEKDRDGCYCYSCLEKKRANERETKIFLKNIGICPSCGKNRLCGEEKQCVECRAKGAERSARIRAERGEEYLKEHRQYGRMLYDRRIKNGVCPRCGKVPDDPRYKMCSACRVKKREQSMARNGQKDRRARTDMGICYFCNLPVKSGYKVCEKHYQMNLEHLNNSKCKEARERIKQNNKKFFVKN